MLYPVSAIPGDSDWLRALVAGHPIAWYVQALHDAFYSLDGPGVLRTALGDRGGPVIAAIQA